MTEPRIIFVGNGAVLIAELLGAAKKTLAGLHQRMDAARDSGAPIPVFQGIADLVSAIAKAERQP